MGRPKKTGLGYFPLDTGFFDDKRIRRLISRFGSDGAAFYLYVLCRAYHNGYCVAVDDDFFDDAALDLNCSAEKIGLMLHYLLDKSLLDGTLFNAVKVLSSHGIQTQYQAIKKTLKRDVEVDGNSWILDESETEGFIKVRRNDDKSDKNKNKSGRNSDKSEINDIKERESKRESKRERERESPTAMPPTLARDTRDLIFLSDEQYSALAADLGETELKRCINYLSEYCSMHGKKYGNWDTAVRKCSREQWGMSTSKTGSVSMDYQPSPERIKKNNDWLDKWFEESHFGDEEQGREDGS